MLRSWTLGNFKAVADTVTLDLAPVTVLCGANSSGKSTILQSILLVAQTLRAKPGEQPLLFNGEYVRLGYIGDILHDSQPNLPLLFGFELNPKGGESHRPVLTNESRFPIQLRAEILSEKISVDQTRARVKTFQVLWGEQGRFAIQAFADNVRDLALPRYAEVDMSPEIRASLQQGVYAYELLDPPASIQRVQPFSVQVALQRFLPYQLLETFDKMDAQLLAGIAIVESILRTYPTDEKIDQLKEMALTPLFERRLREYMNNALVNSPQVRRSTDSKTPTRFYTDVNRFLNLLHRGSIGEWLRFAHKEIPETYRKQMADLLLLGIPRLKPRTEGLKLREVGVQVTGVSDEVNGVLDALFEFFTNYIYYVGPLRESPQYIYSLPPYPELTHVGLKGEFTASVLEHYKGTKVSYPLPPEMVHKGCLVDEAPLAFALQVWLEAMGLLEGVTTTDRGKMGTELTVRSAGVSRDLDLTSIGVGVSQVLPTLVAGLIAPRGTTFLLEQPELHLHPKVQAILADFLLGLSRVGKQCIVETHSEYLVNRLRRRVAEDEADTLDKDVSIYFVEREKGRASFRKVDVNAYGAVIEWPKGFMDEGPDEAQMIMEAAMRKRRRQTQQQPPTRPQERGR